MSAPDRSPFNLGHLKKQAKRVLRACRASDTAAIAGIQASLPRMRALDAVRVAEVIQLADVHHALARQHGVSNWTDLTRFGDPLARLLATVRGGHVHTLRRELPGFAGLAKVSVVAACALGDSAALSRHLTLDQTLATQPHDGWPPIMYSCGSPLARLSLRHATSLADCVDVLLDAGVDATASAMQPEAYGGRAVTPIVRAMMSLSLPVVARLRARGVEQPPYEAFKNWMTQANTPAAMQMHLIFGEYFKRPDVRDRLQAITAEFGAMHPSQPPDLHDLQHLRMPNIIGAQEYLWRAVLERGWDFGGLGVGGQPPLHVLVAYAPAGFVEFYLARGGSMNVRDTQGRSALTTAVRAGNLEVADLLRSHGVDDDATPIDRLIGACLAGDAALARSIVAEAPALPASFSREDMDVLVRAAARGDAGQVGLLLDAGIDPNARNDAGATALHQAAWRGQIDTVRLLVSRGASVTATDELYGETPHAWALHGAEHAQGAREQCLAAAAWLAEKP